MDDVVNEVTSRSTFVGYDDLSPELVRATVAIEDRRFYDHGGVDYIGLMRALVSQLDDNLLKVVVLRLRSNWLKIYMVCLMVHGIVKVQNYL